MPRNAQLDQRDPSSIIAPMPRYFQPLSYKIPYILLLFAIPVTFIAWQLFSKSQVLAILTALTMLLFGLMDGILLAALPRLHLSYGSLGLSWFLILCARIILLLIVTLPLAGLYRLLPAFNTLQTTRGGLILWGILNAAISAIAFYGMYLEPFDLRVTELKLTGPEFYSDRPLRIVQLADLHVERLTKREREIYTRLNTLQPDLIVLTGDYVNYDYARDPRAIQEARTFLSQLHAPHGVYAIPGSTFVDQPETMTQIFSGLDITVLNDQAQALPVGNGVLYLAGVKIDRSGHDRAVLSQLMQQSPPGAYSLLLYHTPDLIETAAQNGVNLYLAGHTHGGQVRLPFIGAVITLSAYGRKYASGLHTLGPTTLYTSRGLGMEGLHLPRARLLCPPEIVAVDIC
jgi:predicted MPP superfamily phosphohydrolase